jgi:hypothetical protein
MKVNRKNQAGQIEKHNVSPVTRDDLRDAKSNDRDAQTASGYSRRSSLARSAPGNSAEK